MNSNRRTDQIKQLIAEATQKAFDRGYQTAWEEFHQILRFAAFRATKDAGTAPKGKKRSANADNVFNFIRDHPGKSGVEIANGLPDIHERTIRTILRRLRLSKAIVQKNGGWFVTE